MTADVHISCNVRFFFIFRSHSSGVRIAQNVYPLRAPAIEKKETKSDCQRANECRDGVSLGFRCCKVIISRHRSYSGSHSLSRCDAEAFAADRRSSEPRFIRSARFLVPRVSVRRAEINYEQQSRCVTHFFVTFSAPRRFWPRLRRPQMKRHKI